MHRIQTLPELLALPPSGEKMTKIVQFVNTHHRSDCDIISEQVPNLLLLLNEGSVAELFAPKAAIFKAIGTDTVYVFPLTSKKISKILMENINSLEIVSYLSSRNFLDLSARTITLKSLEYFFFSFAVLPLVASTSGNTSSYAKGDQKWSNGDNSVSKWSTWSGDGKKFSDWSDKNSSWREQKTENWNSYYESSYAALLKEYVEIALSDNHRVHEARFIRGCQLLLATIIDFWVNVDIFEVQNDRILSLLRVVLESVLRNNSKSKLGEVFLDRIARLLSDLFITKWITRIDLPTCKNFLDLWTLFCQPWLADERTISNWEPFIRKYAFVYNSYPLVLRITAIRDFVADYAEAYSGKNFRVFLDSAKTGVEILVSVLEVCSEPAVLQILAKESACSLMHQNRISESVISVTRQLWAVARECTWHNNSVPRNLSFESKRMDKVVNKEKDSNFSALFDLFVWERAPEDSFGVPKNLAAPVRKPMLADKKEFAWDLPVCESEYSGIIGFLKQWTEILTEVDLRENPKKFALIRKFADVSVLFLLTIFLWFFYFKNFSYWVHLGFGGVLVSMGIKWIRSVMYIV